MPRQKSPELMKAIIEFVEKYYFEHKLSPSLRKISAELSVDNAVIYRYLVDMNARGMLSYDGKSIVTQGIEKSDLEMTKAPILGRIVCGSPENEEENFEEFVALPARLFGKGNFFVLRTHGNSMIEAGIEDGDMVVVKKQDYASDGEIVVALVENENTLKRYYRDDKNRVIILHPENKDMEDIIVRDCKVQGVVKHVVKNV